LEKGEIGVVDIVVRVRIPKELEHLRDRIEETVSKEVETVIKRLEVLRRARGCLKTEKSWDELEAEVHEGIYEDFS